MNFLDLSARAGWRYRKKSSRKGDFITVGLGAGGRGVGVGVTRDERGTEGRGT